MLHPGININEPSDASFEVFSFLSRFNGFMEVTLYVLKSGGIIQFLSRLETANELP
ncbi:hypothetical protein [Methanosarcina siciliae]|uniref:hypothetical protein n=1 Tax=Methanosarcina siciliae TaxID=38027 RepID=UPI000A3DBD93|nr:hypothetical protein [Methanosarcina siciliae]